MNGGRGVDFVIEISGRGTLTRSCRATRQGGLVAVSGYMSDYKPIPQHILDDGEWDLPSPPSIPECLQLAGRVDIHINASDIAKAILYSASNVRGVFVSNREEFKLCNRALEYGCVEPIIDKVSPSAEYGASTVS